MKDMSSAALPHGDEKGMGAELSRPVRLAVATAVAVCLTAVVVHVALIFLYVAPPNLASRLYQKQIDGWVYPYFEQDWRLFAPDPQSVRQQISARTSTIASDGATHLSDWIDLTAVDDAAVRHDVFPSHTAQNMLRRAWAAYASAQGAGRQGSTSDAAGADAAGLPAQHRSWPCGRRQSSGLQRHPVARRDDTDRAPFAASHAEPLRRGPGERQVFAVVAGDQP